MANTTGVTAVAERPTETVRLSTLTFSGVPVPP